MGKKRQLEKQEEIHDKIINEARKIISREGIQGLSIRKITHAIDYSPAIVYHYFKDKNEIVETIVTEGFERILASVRSVPRNDEEPEIELKEIFQKYIQGALSIPEEYKAFMLNDDPAILQRTALLERGITKKSAAMQVLCNNLRRGIELGHYSPCDTELTAQVIWTATFGLIIKLLIEKDIPEEQVKRLIEEHFKLIFHGISHGRFKEEEIDYA